MTTFSYYYPADTEILSLPNQTLDADVSTSLDPHSYIPEALCFDHSEPTQSDSRRSLTLNFCRTFEDLFRDMLPNFDRQNPPPFGALAYDARVCSDYRIGSTKSNGVEVWTSYYIDVEIFERSLVQLRVEYCQYYHRRGEIAAMGIWKYEIFFKGRLDFSPVCLNLMISVKALVYQR
jgi:hypothetical protein